MKTKIVDYVILRADYATGLQSQILTNLHDGWTLQGNIIVQDDVLLQAMVRIKPC